MNDEHKEEALSFELKFAFQESNIEVECGHCHTKFKLEQWQIADGPCQDDKYYCWQCLVKDICGCEHGTDVKT